MAERERSVTVKESVKLALLDLLRDDPDVRTAIQGMVPPVVPIVATLEEKVVEPDAALATWVVGLIRAKLLQYVRPDAFRVKP